MREYNDLASWPIRAAAYLIDVIIPLAGLALIVFGGAIAIGIGVADASGPEGAAADTPGLAVPITLILAGAVIVLGYFVWWLIALRDGQTPGKKIVGIRAVSAHSGETLGWGMMFVREFLVKSMLFSVLGNVTLGVAPLLDFLWPLWDADSQTLHDKIVSTYVVYN